MKVLLTLLLLLVLTVIWALVLRKRNHRFETERKQAAEREVDDGLRFVQTQERALDRSLATLKDNLRSGNTLYQLPWYLVLGQEGAGKTSFINRSNQNFSLTGVTEASSPRAHADPDLAYTIDGGWVTRPS